MTPYIIRSTADVRRIAEQKEQERQEFIERFSGAFHDDGQYEAHCDFGRKRGLLEEINLTAISAQREAEAMHAAERRSKPPARTDGARSCWEPVN